VGGEEEGIMEYRTVARSEARVRIDIFDVLLISLVLARAMEQRYHF
jgi:hypothetical protein